MNTEPEKTAAVSDKQKPEWRTPVLIEESVCDVTRHTFRSGIDRYEGTNAAYGS